VNGEGGPRVRLRQAVLVASELEPVATELQADTPWKAESMKTPMAWDATISKLRELTVRR